MNETATLLETLTETAGQVGPVLEAAAQSPTTYAVAVALAVAVYVVKKRRKK